MKYHLITFGCQMNKSDTERLIGQLEISGHKPAKNIKLADLIIINVCSVRQSAVNRVYDKIKKIRKENPKAKIILTGCILARDKQQFKKLVDEIWDFADLEILAKRQSFKTAFVAIMTGCNNFCSYCAVPYTRGREKSRLAGKIIREVKMLIKNSCQEIILLGQNVNSYHDKKTDFPELLKTLSDLKGNFTLSFMTSHPKDISDDLIKIISTNPKISRQIHLPVQSGDNAILKKMNRRYTIGHYKKLIKKILKQIPGAKISTDIIVGFPTETKKQFNNTVKLFKEIKFNQAYVSCYSPRPGTLAYKYKDDIAWQEKKRRQRVLLRMIQSNR